VVRHERANWSNEIHLDNSSTVSFFEKGLDFAIVLHSHMVHILSDIHFTAHTKISINTQAPKHPFNGHNISFRIIILFMRRQNLFSIKKENFLILHRTSPHTHIWKSLQKRKSNFQSNPFQFNSSSSFSCSSFRMVIL
jgi:hypothetical protein